MTQNAVVTRIIDRRTAEVEVERGTACGGNCGACEACVFQNVIRAVAVNKVSALPGQQVVIESKTGDVMSAAMLLYIVPFVLLSSFVVMNVVVGIVVNAIDEVNAESAAEAAKEAEASSEVSREDLLKEMHALREHLDRLEKTLEKA